MKKKNAGKHWKDAVSTSLRKLVSAPRMGLVTDMDGTISPIVDDPGNAVVTPRNCALLRSLRAKLPLVSIVSGRSVRSVTARMQLPGVVYIGNHGLERCVDGEVRYNLDVEAYRPQLEACVSELRNIPLEDVQVEDKDVTVTLHYRQTQDPQAARDLLLPLVEEIAARHEVPFFEGRMIFEFRPPVNVDKGSAFEGLVHEYTLDSAIYVGDDTTDIAALRAARRLRQERECYALGIGVMSDNSPEGLAVEADLLVYGVPDVENLFAWILENLE